MSWQIFHLKHHIFKLIEKVILSIYILVEINEIEGLYKSDNFPIAYGI